jgi:hypothetical protein
MIPLYFASPRVGLTPSPASPKYDAPQSYLGEVPLRSGAVGAFNSGKQAVKSFSGNLQYTLAGRFRVPV